MSIALERIPDDMLAELWFGFKHQLMEKLQAAFRGKGLQQKDIGARIGKDPATITRLLRGQRDMNVRTMHDLARGMGYRLRLELDDLDELTPRRSNRPQKKVEGTLAGGGASGQVNPPSMLAGI